MHTPFHRFARHAGGFFGPRDLREHFHDCAGHEGRGPGGFFGGPRGGGRGGRGDGEFDGLRGGRGRGGPRPLGHGDLRHLMLHLIAEQPRHGYELIRLIEELFHGAYSPSPGAIYPTLSQLEDMGLIAATAAEGRKRYAITEEGRAHMAQAHEQIEAARMRTHASARDIAKAQIPPAVREAFGRIKHAVLARHGRWTEAEIARVAALLNQAADGLEDAHD
ncbi:MAG TPA: PadR family transcriptional regulator [Stenotrophomonas sp.]